MKIDKLVIKVIKKHSKALIKLGEEDMSLKSAMDVRTLKEFKNNYLIGTGMESKIISAFSIYYPGSWGEPHTEDDELTKQNKEYDYDFFTPDEHWQLEIKYSRTDTFTDGIIGIRRGVWYMRNLGNPKVLFATPTRFALIKVKDILKTKPKPFKPWGDKIVYQLNEEDLDWSPWVTPLCES